MKGDSALLCANIIKTLSKTRVIMMGVSHQTFLTFRKSQNSPTKDLLFDIHENKTGAYL